jgi:hypothetical protein
MPCVVTVPGDHHLTLFLPFPEPLVFVAVVDNHAHILIAAGSFVLQAVVGFYQRLVTGVAGGPKIIIEDITMGDPTRVGAVW